MLSDTDNDLQTTGYKSKALSGHRYDTIIQRKSKSKLQMVLIIVRRRESKAITTLLSEGESPTQ